jgi:hypothetical protein
VRDSRAQLCIHGLKPRELSFHLLHALQIGSLHTAVLWLPVVVDGLRDTVFTADVLHRHAGIGLLHDRDDLGLSESSFLHCSLLAVLNA